MLLFCFFSCIVFILFYFFFFFALVVVVALRSTSLQRSYSGARTISLLELWCSRNKICLVKFRRGQGIAWSRCMC